MRGVALDAAATSRCRRRVHLDHDPTAAGRRGPGRIRRCEQRRADAAEHRVRIGERRWPRPPGRAGTRCPTPGSTPPSGSRPPPRCRRRAGPAHLGRGAARRRPAPAAAAARSCWSGCPAAATCRCIVVRHRITDPGDGRAHLAAARARGRTAPRPDPERRVRSQPRDLLRLAHLDPDAARRGLGRAGRGPAAEHGGVIGLDADVVVWHDLARRALAGRTGPRWPSTTPGSPTGGRWPPRRPPGRPRWPSRRGSPSAGTARGGRRCEVELERGQDVSLVVRGETAVVLREVGVSTVRPAGRARPGRGRRRSRSRACRSPTWSCWPGRGCAGCPWCAGCRGCRCRRADVEVDVDMESFGESGAYLWGALLRHPGGRRPGDEPAGYRAFATWEPVPTDGRGPLVRRVLGLVSAVRARAAATGRSFAAYCYNAQAENRWLLASAERFAGRPGVPTPDRGGGVHRPTRPGSTCSPWSASGSCARTARGSSASPRSAGFSLARPRGRRGELDALVPRRGRDGRRRARTPPSAQRLLEYNADDVAATPTLRDWMTSAAVERVPLATDL